MLNKKFVGVSLLLVLFLIFASGYIAYTLIRQNVADSFQNYSKELKGSEAHRILKSLHTEQSLRELEGLPFTDSLSELWGETSIPESSYIGFGFVTPGGDSEGAKVHWRDPTDYEAADSLLMHAFEICPDCIVGGTSYKAIALLIEDGRISAWTINHKGELVEVGTD